MVNGGVVAVVDGARVVGLETCPPIAAKILTTPDGPELLLVGAAAGVASQHRDSESWA